MVSAEEPGQVRVVFDNSDETNPQPPYQDHTSLISGGALATPTGESLQAIPFIGNWPYMGKRLVLNFVSDAADTIESEESDCEIPVLQVNEQAARQGQIQVVGKETIKLEAMTGFKPSGTVDIALTAGTPARIAHKDAPDGTVYMLNPSGRLRAYFGDDS